MTHADRQAEAFAMAHDYDDGDGLTVKQIAAKYGRSESTVRNRLKKASPADREAVQPHRARWAYDNMIRRMLDNGWELYSNALRFGWHMVGPHRSEFRGALCRHLQGMVERGRLVKIGSGKDSIQWGLPS